MNKTTGKVKNPCKICSQTVNNKNGLQCLGACKKWAHFTCLNFTPGKIQDIKAGLIKVTCPCPGCNTTEPKEYIIGPPFACTNKACAANKLARRDSYDFPSNRPKPIPPAPETRPATRAFASNTTLKSYSSSCPLCPPYSSCPPCPPTPECPTKLPIASSESPRTTPPRSKSPSQPRSRAPTKSSPAIKSPPATPSPRQMSPARSVSPETPPVEPSPTPSIDEAPQPKPQTPSSKRRQQPTNEPDASKDQNKITPQRSQSCSCISSDSRCMQKLSSVSESNLASNNQLLFKALEEMCRTVGELSMQLKELMCKMINSVQDST